MSIRIQCSKCSKRGRVPDASAGKTITCPGCGETVTVPPRSPEEARVDESPSRPAKKKKRKKKGPGLVSSLLTGAGEFFGSLGTVPLLLLAVAVLGFGVTYLVRWRPSSGSDGLEGPIKYQGRTTEEWFERIDYYYANREDLGMGAEVLLRQKIGDAHQFIGTDPASIGVLLEALKRRSTNPAAAKGKEEFNKQQADTKVVEIAVKVLKKFNYADEIKPALPVIEKGLDDPVPAVRIWSLRLLAKLGPEAEPLLPRIAGMIRSPDGDRFEGGVGSAAFSALGAIGPPAIPTFIKIIEDGPVTLHKGVCIHLARYGEKAAPAINAIVAALERSEEKWAADAKKEGIKNRGKPDPLKVVNQLRGDLILVLGEIGPAAASAIPALDKAFHTEGFADLREKIVTTLARLGPDALETMREIYAGGDGEIRKLMASSIKVARRDAAPLTPLLVEMLGDDDATVRSTAVPILGDIGPAAAPALPALIAAIQDTSRFSKDAVSNAILAIAPEAKLPLDDWTVLLRHGEISLRILSAKRIGEFGPDAKKVAPQLIATTKALRPEIAQTQAAIAEARNWDVAVLTKNGVAGMWLRVKRPFGRSYTTSTRPPLGGELMLKWSLQGYKFSHWEPVDVSDLQQKLGLLQGLNSEIRNALTRIDPASNPGSADKPSGA